METATDLKQQVADLQAQLRELQHDLPDSSFQIELQRLQRELMTVLTQEALVPKPQQIVVQPVPPPINLTPGEQVTWGTFTDFHKALLQYSGGGSYMPRGEWQRLANTAAEMTQAASTMGRTDGSMPGPGQIGEFVQASSPAAMPMTCWGGYFTLVTLTLSPGDWSIDGYITFDVHAVTGAASPSWTGWAGISDTPPTGGLQLIGAASEIALLPGGALVAVPILTAGQSFTVATTYSVTAAVQSLSSTDSGVALQAWAALRCRRAS